MGRPSAVERASPDSVFDIHQFEGRLPTALSTRRVGQGPLPHLEGIVSKRLDRAYGAGKCKHWIKVKNPTHPAYSSVGDKLLQSPRSRRSA
jgi:hypothetical protein